MRKVALGIDIGGMSIKSAFMDEEGTISQKFVLPVPKGEDQYVTMNRLIDACKVAIANLPEGDLLVGIGCGVPGPSILSRVFAIIPITSVGEIYRLLPY